MAKKPVKWAKKQVSASLPSLPKWGNAAPDKAYTGELPVDAVEAGVSGLDYHGRLQQLIYHH